MTRAVTGSPRHRRRLPPRRVGPLELVGQLFLTVGMGAALLVGYELWFSNVISDVYQGQAADQLDRQWQAEAPVQAGTDLTRLRTPVDGQGFAKLYLPTIHDEYTVVEGTTQPDLGRGPGHYVGTALPGEPGNLAIAGHRVGHGAPFTDLDQLGSCAPLVVETRNAWFVYRVLPIPDEQPAEVAGCAGAPALQGVYAGLPGRQIVTPDRRDMVAPVPGRAGPAPAAGQRLALITLTTCHPKYSARQRLIVHGVLTRVYAKTPAGGRPAELDET